MQSRYLIEFQKRYEGFLKRSKSLIINSDWHLKKNRKRFSHKALEFKHSTDCTLQVIKGLDEFLSGIEGERNSVGVQPYINSIVDIINIHLKRINQYYIANDPQDHHEIEKRRAEQIIQQDIFKSENDMNTKLNKLNIANDFSNFEINLIKDQIASLTFKTVLTEHDENIKEKVNSLDIDWELIIDNGIYVNIPKSQIPKWNTFNHFFDQEEDSLQFYASEWNKITQGYDLDGYYFHPWLYFHINYFTISMPVKNERGVLKDIITRPPLRRNEWYFAEIIKLAEEKNQGAAFIFGTRRFSKSTLEASYLLWKAITSPNSEGSITTSNDKDRLSVVSKMQLGVKHLPSFLSIHTNITDWEKVVEIGLKTRSKTKIAHFNVRVVNTSDGVSSKSQGGAGMSPVAYIYDESGKSEFLEGWRSAKFGFKAPEGWRAIPIFTGTASNSDITKDAEKVLNNPTKYDFLENDWDLLEYRVPKNAITWKRRTFPFFVPAQMSYETGLKSIKMKFSDFIDIKSERLSQIEFQETDWEHNSAFILSEQKRLEKLDKDEYRAYLVFLPIDPEHCFLSAKKNPFPAIIAQKHQTRLKETGNDMYGTALPITLHRDEQNPEKIISKISNKEPARYPHAGGHIDAPFLLYGDFPTEKPPSYLYYATLDDYKHEKSDGDSVASFIIRRRNLGMSPLDGKIALTLSTRPEPHSLLHSQIHLALEKYNAMLFPENEDMKIKEYFDRRGLSHRFLVEGKGLSQAFQFSHTGNRKYGIQPTKITVPMALSLAVDECKKVIEIFDEDGNVIDTKLGVELIDDIYLLEEIIKYKNNGGNYDRLVTYYWGCLYEEYLNTHLKLFPRHVQTEEERLDEIKRMRTSGNKKGKLLRAKKRHLLGRRLS